MRKKRYKQDFVGYLYILPSLVFVLTFCIIPVFMSFYFSLTEFNVVNPAKFIGLDNFARMLRDPFMKQSLINTLVYTALVVPVQTFFALLIAAFLAGNLISEKLANIIKSSLFIPVISSMILVGTIWTYLLSTDNGLVNILLSLFGLPKVNWFGQKNTALLSICIVGVWRNVGYFLVIFYAGIQDIPRSLFEAAEIDGANGLKRFVYITLPYLKPITFLVVILGTIWSFQVFDLVYTMTGGGPGRSTMTLVLHIYATAFREYSMGYASAISFILFLIILVVSLLQKVAFSEKRS